MQCRLVREVRINRMNLFFGKVHARELGHRLIEDHEIEAGRARGEEGEGLGAISGRIRTCLDVLALS